MYAARGRRAGTAHDEPCGGQHDKERCEEEEQHGNHRAQARCKQTPQAQRQTVDNGKHAQQRVENANPCEVGGRPEMTDAFFFRWIINVYGNGVYVNAMP